MYIRLKVGWKMPYNVAKVYKFSGVAKLYMRPDETISKDETWCSPGCGQERFRTHAVLNLNSAEPSLPRLI